MRPGRAAARAALLCALALPALAAPTILRQGTSADPPSLDPSVAAGTLAAPIIADLFAGLVVRDAESRPAPGAAESWAISADARTYTFRLRSGLRWSDGAPLTAEDFVYSFRRVMAPETGSLLAGLLFFIENGAAVHRRQLPVEALGVRAPDPRTFVIALERPVPYLIQLLANLQLAPVPRHAIERYGRDWTRADRMVSNGAYRLVERVPQNYIRLARNPHFFAAGSVRIDEVWWYPTQDLGTSFRRYRAGELDIILNFPPGEIDWIRRNLAGELHIVPALASYFLIFNTRRPPFDDQRVRRALSIAIDRETITDKLLRTGVRPAWSFAPPDFQDYGGVTVPEQRLPLAARQAEARRLLLLAGFGPARPLTVPLLYDSQEENRKLMVAIAAMWQAIGVRTELTNVEFRALQNRVRAMDYAVARWTYFAAFDDAYAFLQLLGSDNPNNWVKWSDARYDALLERANATQEAAGRTAMLREAETLMLKEQPLVPIYFYVARRLIAPRVRGWHDTPRGMTPTRYLWIARGE